MIVAELKTLAKLVVNTVTGGASFSESTVNHKVTCPVNKRWFVVGGLIERDVSATLNVRLKNAAGIALLWLDTESAATGQTNFPGASEWQQGTLVPMDAGWYLDVVFGAAQSTVGSVTIVVLEIDV